jgi:hypothetical protein
MAKEDKSRIRISEIDREICESVNTVNTPEERRS